ncbi:MAG TPA: hypothetical protein VLJ76_03735 [Gaiellaceae bacterium]|nr:hypothetical protein [Gaiellaceae bacterium]
MGLAERWERISASLPGDWERAELRLSVADQGARDRAAALLGALAPGRAGDELRFVVSRSSGIGPEAARRLLARLDEEKIAGTLALVDSSTAAPAAAPVRDRLAAQWDGLVAGLPADWSDLLCRVDLASSDDLPRAALLAAPVNPSRPTREVGFEFRVARESGYGASAQMTRRCLARIDEDGIPGRVELLRSLSDTHHVSTQGPVWYVAGKVL